MAITLNGTGTIEGISVGGLPDGIVDNDMLASGTPNSAALPAGSILQVVQANEQDVVNSTTSTYADTGLTATITPSSSSSKVLVLAYEGHCAKSAADTQLDLRLYRGSTNILTHTALNTGTSEADTSNITICYLDSPATTSATIYKTQLRNRDASGTVYVNLNGTAIIILMEVAG